MDLDLKDKIAFVAGSTRGIGRSIAEAFLHEGARVILTGRTQADLDRAVAELSVRHGEDRVLSHCVNLTREDDVKDCLESVRKSWGGVDCLVANVGSGQGSRGWNIDATEWHRLLDLNLIGSSLLASCAIPLLEERRGASITFISSLAGVESLPAPIPYASAKAGLLAMSKMLSRLLAEKGIRVNVVAPGNILFAGGGWAKQLERDARQVEAYIENEVPIKRLGTPEEVADAVIFLSSARASFITGGCLLVDGGQSRGWLPG